MKISNVINFVDPIYMVAFFYGFIEKKYRNYTENEKPIYVEPKNSTLEIAQKSHVVFIGERDRLIVTAYDGYIKRTIKTELGRLNSMGNIVETVKILEPFTPNLADSNFLNFTVEDAVEYTCRELHRKAIVPTDAWTPVVNKSEVKPKTIEPEKSAEKSVALGFGMVVSADRITVQPEGRSPYETFQVVVKDQAGVTSIYNGKDLEQKFAQGVFKVGQQIKIERKKSSNFKIEKGGKSASFSKNEFDIHVFK